MSVFPDASQPEIEAAMEGAATAGMVYKKASLAQRAALLNAIADGLEQCDVGLLQTAMAETNLPHARLSGEKNRTIFQLRNYAAATLRGDWLDLRINTAIPQKQPPAPDLRKMMLPLGPVVVFGASNFPFAYSTAGGDTASALAAGCTVVVKAHPAHAKTSEKVAAIIHQAVEAAGLPAGVFTHLHGINFNVGKALVLHPKTKAVAFTGSFSGGKALFDLGAHRPEPIPVFAEMGSLNPVFLLPEKLNTDALAMAQQLAASITLSMGQFCTKPGLVIGVHSEALSTFTEKLGAEMARVIPAEMLHEGIAGAFSQKANECLQQPGVSSHAAADWPVSSLLGQPITATVSGKDFLRNRRLHQEVFGPMSLVVDCTDEQEMMAVAHQLQGQLTTTIMGTENDLNQHPGLLELATYKCGRLILNGVPTGVEVSRSMQHGGPFPATTDSRFTAVGADAIRRFIRPLCFQNFPDHILPVELQNANPLGLYRMVNDEMTNRAIQ